jgi:hypothetical protein
MKKKNITDIPATTASKQAADSFRQGLLSLDQNDNQTARTNFLKAIELDPNLAIAYILKSGTDLSPKEFTDDLSKAKSRLEGDSEWEKLYYEFTVLLILAGPGI